MLPLTDNAVFLAYTRLRLRPLSALAALGVVTVLLVAQALQQLRLRQPDWTWYVHIHVFLTIVPLVWGALRVGREVSAARESGLLDFHRASPTRPLDHAIGYLLGAPIREWIAAVFLSLPIPVGVWLGGLPPRVLLVIPILFGTALLLAVVSLAAGLFLRVGTGLVLGVGLFLLGRVAWGGPPESFLLGHAAAVFALDGTALQPPLRAFGFALHPLTATVALQGTVWVFAAWIAARRLRNAQAPALPRVGLLFALAASLFWLTATAPVHVVPFLAPDPAAPAHVNAVVMLLLTTAAVFLLVPSALAQRRAARRAAHDGRAGLGTWAEGGSPWPLTAVFAGLFLLALTTVETAGVLPVATADTGIRGVVGCLGVAAFLVQAVAIPTYLRTVWPRAELAGAVVVALVLGALPGLAALLLGLLPGTTPEPGWMLVASPLFSGFEGLWQLAGALTGAPRPFRPDVLVSAGISAATATWMLWRAHLAR